MRKKGLLIGGGKDDHEEAGRKSESENPGTACLQEMVCIGLSAEWHGCLQSPRADGTRRLAGIETILEANQPGYSRSSS
jgi:hypothetical protein